MVYLFVIVAWPVHLLDVFQSNVFYNKLQQKKDTSKATRRSQFSLPGVFQQSIFIRLIFFRTSGLLTLFQSMPSKWFVDRYRYQNIRSSKVFKEKWHEHEAFCLPIHHAFYVSNKSNTVCHEHTTKHWRHENKTIVFIFVI